MYKLCQAHRCDPDLRILLNSQGWSAVTMFVFYLPREIVVVHLLSHVQLFVNPWTSSMLGFPVLHCSPRVCSDSYPLSWWCHPTISSSVAPFSSCPQSFPASRFLRMSWLFALGGESIAASASASVLPLNIQNWFPLGLTGLISLLSKGLLRVFSSTTVQKHQFFGV